MALNSLFEANLGRLGRSVLDALLPPRCPGCGTVLAPGLVEHGLCAACWGQLRFIADPLCDSCGKLFDYPVPGRKICLDCLADPPVFRRARAVFRYDDGCRDLILGFKHADRTELAPFLGRLACQAGRDLLATADGLIPVPLHRDRLARRRFNQAALLAGAISAQTGVENMAGIVVRHRATASQTGGAGKRARNVAGAFSVAKGHELRVENRSLVIVDDVFTTGATVSAVAKLLLRHGAAEVSVLTLARVDRG